MKNDKLNDSADNLVEALNSVKKRKYAAPKILSREKLEAAAATCSPTTGALGKTVPIPCGTLGS